MFACSGVDSSVSSSSLKSTSPPVTHPSRTLSSSSLSKQHDILLRQRQYTTSGTTTNHHFRSRSSIAGAAFVTPSAPLSMPIKTINVPTMGDSITEGTIVDIPVAPGDYVNEDDVVVVLETDKVSVDVRASEGGKVVEILGEVDDVVGVGSALYRLDTDVAPPAAAGGGKGAASASTDAPKVETPIPPSASPAAASVAPTPPPPVAASTPPPPSPKKAAAAPKPPSLPAMEVVTTSLGNRPERRSKMSRMR
jgi:biotin carboxyl carrier protein